MFFNLNLYILFIVVEAELGFILITDDISAVNLLDSRAQFLIVNFSEILEIFLLFNLSIIFIHFEGSYERTKILFAYFPLHFTDTFYD